MKKPVVVGERLLALRKTLMAQSYGLAWIVAVALFVLWPILGRSWDELLPLLGALIVGVFYFTIRAIYAGVFELSALSRDRGRTTLGLVLGFSGYFIFLLLSGSSFFRALWGATMWIVLFGLGMYGVIAISSGRAKKME